MVSGLLWVGGRLEIQGPATFKGTIIAGDEVKIGTTGSSVVSIKYDSTVLDLLRQEVGRYRFSRSFYFDDGTTSGTIGTRGGWAVAVTDRITLGVEVSVSGAGSVARLGSCANGVETRLDAAGEAATITCGTYPSTFEITASRASPTIGVYKGTGRGALRAFLRTGQTITVGSPLHNFGPGDVTCVHPRDREPDVLEPGHLFEERIVPTGHLRAALDEVTGDNRAGQRIPVGALPSEMPCRGTDDDGGVSHPSGDDDVGTAL